MLFRVIEGENKCHFMGFSKDHFLVEAAKNKLQFPIIVLQHYWSVFVANPNLSHHCVITERVKCAAPKKLP